jgi:hypothetical protein
MGYQRKPTIYRLLFPDDFPELEVFARSVSIEEYLKIAKLADQMTSKPGEEQVRELFTWFARRLVRWNLEDEDGKPVPATLKGLMGEELPFVFKIVMAWVNKVVGVSAPLRTASGDGVPSAAPDPTEATIPMTTPDGMSGSPPS